MPPPSSPPQQRSSEITSMVDYLTELMEKKLAENNSLELNDADKESIMAALAEKFDIDEEESVINTTV